MKAEVVFNSNDWVGESPVWEGETESLYWVDVVGRKINQWHARTGCVRTWSTPGFPTAICLCEGGHESMLAMADGLYQWDFQDAFRKVHMPDPLDGNRLNDGRCDPQGRMWIGSMETNLNADGTARQITRHRGAFFRYDRGARSERLTAHEFGITNTLAWSPDQQWFYCADTLRNLFFRFEYHPEEGLISNPTVWPSDRLPGYPDGSCMDDDGCLWNARFGGGCVVRITPRGTVDRVVPLPVENPTSCTFGGDRHTLYITSARFGLSKETDHSQEGALLALTVDPGGAADFRFRRS
jgi:sugar lactone lactonase YvrE